MHTEMFALALDLWAYTAVFSALFDQYMWVMQGAGFTLRTEYSESEQKAINERYYYPLSVLDIYSELRLLTTVMLRVAFCNLYCLMGFSLNVCTQTTLRGRCLQAECA